MMQPSAKRTRLTIACAHCREKKMKCSGATPCAPCERQQRDCWYPTSRRGKRAKNEHHTQRTSDGQQGRQHSAPFNPPDPKPTQTQQVPDTTTAVRILQAFPESSDQQLRVREISVDGEHRTQSLISPVTEVDPNNLKACPPASESRQPLFPTPADLVSPIQVQSSAHLLSQSLHAGQSESDGPDPAGAGDGEEESVVPLQKVNWEHHGPWSWVSICSPPALRWICERTRSDEFISIANGLTKTWSRRLKIRSFRPLKSTYAEPEPDVAWKYINAYFEQSYDAAFGIIHRPTFEARISATFQSPVAEEHDDPSWFALRNIVYAAGCRVFLVKEGSVPFTHANAQATRYFQNALSVFSEMIFGHTGFTAVQALTLMTYYAEVLGGPSVEYPLCASALQLAVAKGLHRDPSKSLGLSKSESLSRRWLWWMIYNLEKHIAFRTGRPSKINDEYMSVTIPTEAPPGSTIDVEIATLLVRLAQITSEISNRLMSGKALKQSTAQTIDNIHQIHGQLQELLDSVPSHLTMDVSNPSLYFPSMRGIFRLLLHFAIHGAIMATHIILFYPWTLSRFGDEADPEFQSQVKSSADIIAHSARQIILALRCVTVDVASPAWMTFYYPMYAHINLFIYLLRSPPSPNTMGDLALLDICAGHFGHVEQVTASEISFHFPRESAALCQKLNKSERDDGKGNETVPATPLAEPSTVRSGTENVWDSVEGEMAFSITDDMAQSDVFGDMDFNMESWNIFSSIDLTGDLTTAFDPFVEL